MAKKLTKEEINQRLKNNFEQKVELAGEYINKRTKFLLKCNECGYQWEALPTSTLYSDYKHKCPNCGFKKGKIVKCAYCGKEIYRSNSQLKKSKSGFYYCSRECGNRHKNELIMEDNKNPCNYRLSAFKTYPHKCMVCGWDEDERILEVHHIDENHSNNEINNLSILCPTCHRKITLGYYVLTDDFKLLKK